MAYVTKNLVKQSDTSTIVYPNIISDNIPASAVTTDKVASGAITNDKIADDEITISKLYYHLYQHSYNIRWQKTINGVTYSCSFSVRFISQQGTAYTTSNIITYINSVFAGGSCVGEVKYYSLNSNTLEFPFVCASSSSLVIEDTNGDEYDIESDSITLGTYSIVQLY